MKLLKKIETLFAAVAFAEEGEHETAKKMVEETREAGEGRKADHKDAGLSGNIRINPSRV